MMFLGFAQTLVVFLSLLIVKQPSWKCQAAQLTTIRNDDLLPGGFAEYPSSITLRGGVIEDHPFAFIDQHNNGTFSFRGFEIDFLERIKAYAAQDGVNLNFILSPAPSKYNEALNLVANDCNTTANPNTLEDCNKFDFIVGDYFSNPTRYARVDFTPTWLTATMTSVKYLDKSPGVEDYSTVGEVEKAGATMCLLDGTYVTKTVQTLWPNLNVQYCHKQDDCFAFIKNETCALWTDDSTQLSYRVSQDPSLALSPETFKPQFFVWPMKFQLPEVVRYLVKRWTYMGTSTGELAELYHQYFEAKLCPVGSAGLDCELPCDLYHGRSDARGRCVCESTKWTGDDCSIEVLEDKNLIPSTLVMTGYAMFGINVGVCVASALWLFWKRKAPQVLVAQPMFLAFILVGCIISSSTILALAAQDEGDGPVPACMAIPWLYSIGFCITFGTLFAKILRVHKICVSSVGMRRIKVTTRATLLNIAAILFVDIIILFVWTMIDPLIWERTITSEDKFGEPLQSVGFCTCDHWQIFAGSIALLHFIVLAIACYLCYVTRKISDRLAESKYLAIAMVSNFQIFIVGVPVLIIIGADPNTSFFVRSAIVWINDFVVVCLIFGNIMYAVHFKDDVHMSANDLVKQSMKHYLGTPNDEGAAVSAGNNNKNGADGLFASSNNRPNNTGGEQRPSFTNSTPNNASMSLASISMDRWEKEISSVAPPLDSNTQHTTSGIPFTSVSDEFLKKLEEEEKNRANDDHDDKVQKDYDVEKNNGDLSGDTDAMTESNNNSSTKDNAGQGIMKAIAQNARSRFALLTESLVEEANSCEGRVVVDTKTTTDLHVSKKQELPIISNDNARKKDERTKIQSFASNVLQEMETEGITMEALLTELQILARPTSKV